MFLEQNQTVTNISVSPSILFTFGQLEQAPAVFLMTCAMHKNNIISDARLKAEFKKIRASYDNTNYPKNMGYKHTYHCSINDAWYNDMSYYDIMMSICEDENCLHTMLDTETLLFYINRCFNKTKNWCIDWLWFEIIERKINPIKEPHINHNEVVLSLTNDKLQFSSYVDYDSYDPGMYCCSDCDGPFDKYKSMHYDRYVCKDNFNEVYAAFKTYTDNLKKR